ncbi:MAG: HNH endonuclease [Pyrinomonadaceae bacterium]|nr:HNH endonuclease [Pyrinomonadaceae bacterium]
MNKKSVSSEIRRDVIERAKGFCEYCRSNSRFADSPFDVEHILPESKGGATMLENLALACHGCNLSKSNKIEFLDAMTDKMVSLFNPRIDVWSEHFVWTSDYSEVVGITAVGRATVEALNLNRDGLVNQRKVLHKYGKHPPDDFS